MSEQAILAMVKEILEKKGDTAPVGIEDSLVYSGRLRSMQIIELASQLEITFAIDFGVTGFNQYDFDSVLSILALLSTTSNTQR